MSSIRRAGNFGIADTSHGLMSFSVGAMFGGEGNVNTINFSQPETWNDQRVTIGKYDIIPLGYNNDLPLEIMKVLDESYSGEGILGKIQGLQWGEGPRLYVEEENEENGTLMRRWKIDKEVTDWLESFNAMDEIMKCHTDLTHGLGYFVKLKQNKAWRIGQPSFINELEHVSVSKARLEWPGLDKDYPENIITGAFPYPRIDKMYAYPIWKKNAKLRHPVYMAYQSIYSFCKSAYSTPRFFGALNWMRLSNSIAPLLLNYNANASAISYHIESPQEYWDNVQEKLKNNCYAQGIEYSDKMLEDYKDKAFEDFSAALSGAENVGKFMHTQSSWNDEARNYQGWKITPIDKKIKDYVDAQIAIADKGDSASTSGFGLHPALSNIIVDGKLSSGSEMIYALKGYISTETAIPEMILFGPWNDALKINFPGKNLKLGFFRNIVQLESQVTPNKRISESV